MAFDNFGIDTSAETIGEIYDSAIKEIWMDEFIDFNESEHYIIGEIQNIFNTTLFDVTVHVDFYDSEGKLSGRASGNVNHLMILPGEISTFDLITYVGGLASSFKISYEYEYNGFIYRTLNNQSTVIKTDPRESIEHKEDYLDLIYSDRNLAFEPNDTRALYRKGVALQDLGIHDEAISHFDRILAIEPNATDAINRKKLSLSQLQK